MLDLLLSIWLLNLLDLQLYRRLISYPITALKLDPILAAGAIPIHLSPCSLPLTRLASSFLGKSLVPLYKER